MSYISMAQNPLWLKSLSNKHKVSASPCRRTSPYFLCILALWASLNIFRDLLLPPLVCSIQRREKDADNEFWKWAQSEMPQGIRPCLNFSGTYRNLVVRSLPRRYLMVVVSGGLNQQRNQIVDAVIIARILRATLIIPVLQVNQVWGDESEFGDIFDETHFKEVLKNDVVIVSSLPLKQLRRRRVRSPIMPFRANEDWVLANYGTNVLFQLFSALVTNMNSFLQEQDVKFLSCIPMTTETCHFIFF